MVKSYKLYPTAKYYLKSVRSHKKPYYAKILGKKIIIYPDVMSPKYDWTPNFHIQNIPDQKGKSWLEIGCGSGVLSVFASLQGAASITAVDINPAAIENTERNLKLYNCKNYSVFYSNVFSNVKGKFDTIVFAAPYNGSKPRDMLEHALSDYNYRTLKIFFRDAYKFLNKNGTIILGFADIGDVRLVDNLIKKYGYSIYTLKSAVRVIVKNQKYNWTVLLYILKYGSAHELITELGKKVRVDIRLKTAFGMPLKGALFELEKVDDITQSDNRMLSIGNDGIVKLAGISKGLYLATVFKNNSVMEYLLEIMSDVDSILHLPMLFGIANSKKILPESIIEKNILEFRLNNISTTMCFKCGNDLKEKATYHCYKCHRFYCSTHKAPESHNCTI